MTEQGAQQMLPDVRKFIDAVEAATAARRAAVDTAAEKYPNRYGRSQDAQRQALAYSDEIERAYTTCSDVREAAWNALKTSGDPLVRWIAENCAEYPMEARQVLTALPAALNDLDAVAEVGGWCSVWNAFRQRAIDAGVVPGVTPVSQARRAVFDLIDREACCPMGQASKRRIGEALDALIQEAGTDKASATEARSIEATA
ncbi:hypothetical protein AB0L61_39000 [Streptomyces tendae]|uniref:hypothetical protein n=1 Tax=Streptomyces tendae TaxID=1932 RepID=UPI003448B410